MRPKNEGANTGALGITTNVFAGFNQKAFTQDLVL